MFQRLNYGVVFQQKTQLYIAQDYWYHTFEIELPEAFPLPRLPSCKKNNSTCKMISHFLSQLDSIRAETAERFNTTNLAARSLIPETNIHKSRSKRSLLPFLGKISRGLFGTATVDDINVLAGHINKLNKMALSLSRALTQHEDHLSSVIKTANERMDNLMSGIKENNLAIKFIQNELHTTATNIEQSVDYMMGLLIDQVKTSTKLNHALDQFKDGIISLVNGKLSPLLIPEDIMQSTFQDINMLLQTKFNGFHLTLDSVNEIYAASKFLYARNNTKIYITIKLPISHFKVPLTAYEVISVPVPINSTSNHATQLLDLPKYFIIAGNKQYYAGISIFDFNSCSGKRIKYCQANVALSPVTSVSCVLALFGNDKAQVKSLCNFRFLQDVIKDVVWDIFVFALGNTPGFHLIRAKVCSVFKLKFALNIPYYVYLFLETRHTISRCHIATHFDLKACPSTCLNLFVVTKCLKHTLGYHDTDITIYMHQQTQKANMAKEVFV